jgi:hypothetical protein
MISRNFLSNLNGWNRLFIVCATLWMIFNINSLWKNERLLSEPMSENEVTVGIQAELQKNYGLSMVDKKMQSSSDEIKFKFKSERPPNSSDFLKLWGPDGSCMSTIFL